MKIQKTDWGYIEWLYPVGDLASNDDIRVGVSCLLPNRRQNQHVHYGHDQFLYCLEGQGIHYINGQEKVFKAGDYFYIPEGSTHKTINTGDIVTKELLIANPKIYETELNLDDDSLGDMRIDNLLYDAVEAIRISMLESLSMPFIIFDESWSVVVQGNNYPEYCVERCNPRENRTTTDCLIKRHIDGVFFSTQREFTCKYGFTVFDVPIIHRDRELGVVRGGHVLLSGGKDDLNKDVFEIPESTVVGIKSLLFQISKSLVSYCDFALSNYTLMHNNLLLEDSETRRVKLEDNLSRVNDIVTNLKINHHFLFNTLNAMAFMALEGDRYDLYKAIINLSTMFRYTMETNLKFISLSKEIHCLNTYLELQKLRYGSKLKINYIVDEIYMETKVPFNFLQPIVENAFIHGFLHYDEDKYIEISVDIKDEKYLELLVFNNGNALDYVELNRVNKNLSNKSGHGLSLIYDKLESAYGEDFVYRLESKIGSGTRVRILIPLQEERK